METEQILLQQRKFQDSFAEKRTHTQQLCERNVERERGEMQLGVGMGEKEKSKKKKRKEREREEMNNYWVSDSWG